MALRLQGSLVHWGRGIAQRALVSATQHDGPSRPLDLAAEVHDHTQVLTVLTQFRHRGHLLAQLDPLKRVPFGPWLGSANAEARCAALSYGRTSRAPSLYLLRRYNDAAMVTM